MNLETEVGPVLPYSPYYIYQMMVAGGCTLLKLCKSFFASHLDMDYTKGLFNRTIWAVRGVSVSSNDLPERLAEVLAQMWRLGGSSLERSSTNNTDVDDTLMLKVRCRMSMSLLFDSVWRWREDARTRGRNIEGMFTSHCSRVRVDSHCNSVSQKPNKPGFKRGLLSNLVHWRHAYLFVHAWCFSGRPQPSTCTSPASSHVGHASRHERNQQPA